jgi:ELWxxDGT repeat protein
MVAAGSRIEIALSAPLYGTIVWRSDGTAAGTWGIGWVPAMATLLAASPDEAGTRYLSVYTAGGRDELWALSPASGALRLTGSLASITDWAATTAGLIFSAAPVTAPPARAMLWSSDGSVAGTHPLVIPAGGTLADAHIWCSDGATAYLTAQDRDSGTELWISDGTPDGTSRLTDLAPGPASSDPHDVTVVTSRIYFGAHDGASPDDLWMIDRRPADFNNDGAVGPQDVLDFLIEYLAGRDRADFNGIDGVTIEDMLAWMVFWFAGRE